MNLSKFFIYSNDTIYNSLEAITLSGSKCLVVVDKQNKIKGTISDGDIRRSILRGKKLSNKINDIYNKKPKYIFHDKKNNKILQNIFLKDLVDIVPVIDNNKKVVEVIRIDDVFSNNNLVKKRKLKFPVIIIAGGLGNRLKPFTDVLPKALIPINKKPIIDHIMENFEQNGATNFLISINYKSKIMKAYFEEMKKNLKIKFIEEKKPLGTIGSLNLIKNYINKYIFVTNCDVIINFDYQEILKHHLQTKNEMTIVTCTKNFKIPYGNCKVDTQGNLKKIEEKPNYNLLINTGMYIINKNIINYIPKNTKFDVDNLINILIKNKIKIGVFPISDSNWTDIGQWNEYKKTIEIFNKKNN